MNDTNPQTNEDYINPEQNQQSSEGASQASDNSENPAGSSSSTSPQSHEDSSIAPLDSSDSSSTDDSNQQVTQEASSSASQSNQHEGVSQFAFSPDLPPLPGSLPQYNKTSQYDTPEYHASQPAAQSDASQTDSQYSGSQPTPQSSDSQAAPQYNAAQSSSQYDAVQSTSQYDAAQSTPQYNAAQPASQYNTFQQAPYDNLQQPQQAPQYDNPQQSQSSFQSQFQATPPTGGQGGMPAFNGGMPGQPYGNPNQGGFASPMAVPLNMPYYGCPPFEAVKRFFRKYAKFSGRASRSEYWWVQLFIFIVYVIIFVFDELLFRTGSSFIDYIWEVAIFIPQIAIAIRRLHDSNKSGWWWILPYGLEFAGVLILGFSVGFSLGGLLANPSSAVADTFGAGVIGGSLLCLLFLLVGFILQIVLMVLGPKPEGVRFDEDVPPMNPVNPGNPAGQYDQYGQFIPQQNPANQPYSQAQQQSASAGNSYSQAPYQQTAANNSYAQPYNDFNANNNANNYGNYGGYTNSNGNNFAQ